MNRTAKIAGRQVCAIGQGTWFLGENPALYKAEKEALETGFREGMTIVDTAEMYGSGKSEILVGDALKSIRREDAFVVSKVLPSHADKRSLPKALENSLRRLSTDYLDLYLYHWRGGTPLAETVFALEEMKSSGKIRAWGVSNFDTDDMEELFSISGGKNCAANQVLYHLGSRGIEYDLKPWLKSHGVSLMAYCPLAQGGSLRRGLFENSVVKTLAEKYNVTVSEILLAWCIRDGNTIAIPRTAKSEHTKLNARACRLELSDDDLALLDKAFPPPQRKMRLDIQ